MILAVAHQGVEEFAVLLLVLQGTGVARHPVDDQPLDLVRFDGPDDAREVDVQLQLARAVVEELDGAAVQMLAQVEAEGFGVAHDLFGVLVEGDHQAALLVLDPFQEQLRAQHRLARAGDAHHHGHRAVEDAAAEQRVEGGGADDRLPGVGRGLGPARDRGAGSGRGGTPPARCRR